MSLEFVLDYRSPYSYLANTRVAELSPQTTYQVIDIIDVMGKVHNQPSPECPAKSRYSALDATRWAMLYQVAWAPNMALMGAMRDKAFDGAFLSRAGLAAQGLGLFDRVNDALFAAVWASSHDLLSAEGKAQFLVQHGLDADIWAHGDSPAIREQLAAANESAAARGVFGVPTFFVGKEMFFGNDRLDFVRAALKQQSA